MPIIRSSYNEHLVVTIKGNMDARFIQSEREDLDSLLSEVKDVILFDLSRTDFIDSSGIGFLVYIYKRIKPQKCAMAIIGLKGQPKEVVEMLNINRLIDCVDTLQAFTDQKNAPRRGIKRISTKTNRQRVDIKSSRHA